MIYLILDNIRIAYTNKINFIALLLIFLFLISGLPINTGNVEIEIQKPEKDKQEKNTLIEEFATYSKSLPIEKMLPKIHDFLVDFNSTQKINSLTVDNITFTTQIQPLGFIEMDNILNYLVNTVKYIDLDNETVNLESLKSEPKTFVQGAVNIANGLLRAAEVVAYRNENATKYLNLAENILSQIDDTRLTNGIYYVNHSLLDLTDSDYPNVDEYLVLMRENAYAISLKLELMNWYSGFVLTQTSFSVGNIFNMTKAIEYLIEINKTYSVMRDTFYNDSMRILFVEKAYTYDNGSLVLGSQGDMVYTESMGLMHQIISGIVNAGAYLPNFTSAIMPAGPYRNLLTYERRETQRTLNDIMTLSSVPFDTIRLENHNTIISIPHTGIAVEFINRSETPSIANSTSAKLMSQIFRMENFLFHGLSYVDFNNTNAILIANIISDLMYNTLRLFLNSKGLPVHEILLNESSQSEFTSTFEIHYLFGTIKRLAGLWDRIAEAVPEQNFDEKSRTWLIAGTQLREALNTYLYDDQTDSFFPLYDNSISNVIRDDSDLLSNSLVANAVLLESLSSRFPYYIDIVTQDYINIKKEQHLSVQLNNITFSGPWTFFTFFLSGVVEVKISSTSIGFSTTKLVDINALDEILDFTYTVLEKGEFDIKIELVKEGEIVLSEIIILRALGTISIDSLPEYTEYSDENYFSIQLKALDEKGVAIEGLDFNLLVSNTNYNIIISPIILKTDSSGIITPSIDLGILKPFIDPQNNSGSFIFSINSVNSTSLYLKSFEKHISFVLVQAELSTLITPSKLELTKGIGGDYSFQAHVINQLGDPINLVNISLKGDGITTTKAITDNNGNSILTLKEFEIRLLPADEVTNLILDLNHPNYPLTSVPLDLNVIGNELRLSATPFRTEVRTRTIFESSVDSILFKIDAEDLFGNQISTNVKFSWQSANGNQLTNTGQFPNLPIGGITPFTFTLDPSILEAGTYYILVSGSKDGFVSGDVIVNLIVRGASFLETGEILIGFTGLYVIGIILGFARERVNLLLGRYKACPHCGNSTNSKMPACKTCGNFIDKEYT